jgi:uncharacterized repeat protein (TIGR01451 family)
LPTRLERSPVSVPREFTVSPSAQTQVSSFGKWLRRVTAVLAFAVPALLASPAGATPPPAGANIGNQASATYSDSSGVSHIVTSNVVQTTVQQVASLTLTANGAQTATVGSVVYYPQTLTNTGNGSDSFALGTTNSGAFTMANVALYADNGSGQPIGSPITSTGQLAAGAAFKFIVVATLPTTATAGQTNAVVVTGTSAFNGAQTASATDTTKVTLNAVITVTKAVSVASGAPGSGPFTYTLTYTNTGNATATSVVLTDVVPGGMTYVTGQTRWSVTGSTALNESGATAGTAPNTATLSISGSTITVTLNQVTAGQSGTVSFEVNVGASTVPGVLNNTAAVSYNDGSGTTVNGSTNTVPFTVTQTAAVTLTPPSAIATAAPGSTISFTNVVHNTGNGTDTFNITLGSSNYPTGTTFQLFKSDGVTPLSDTNGDGIPDTGPVAAGATYNVILKATLPPNATDTGAPFSISKIATSVTDPTKTATGSDTLTAIAAASVDLTGNAAIGGSGVVGVGAGPEASAQQTVSTNPAASATFLLVANNTGPAPDTYNLQASTASNFSSQTLPSGWTVVFQAPNSSNTCSPASGTVISSTPTVAATTGTSIVCAVVSVPAGYPAGTDEIYFRAISPNSGAADTINDAVTVNAVRALTDTPNGTGQTYPGGSYVYNHTLTNSGNVTEGNGTLSTINLATVNNQAGWTSVLYYDANNSGALTANDPQISGNLNTVTGLAAGLAPGQSITIFDKVIAPSGAQIGAVDNTSITATTTNGSYTTGVPTPVVTVDGTTVIAGNLNLVKQQGLDTNCNGTVASYTAGNLSVAPGGCLMYQITVTNVGSANATNVVVSDATPTFTTMNTAPATTVGTVAVTGGTVNATIGTLTPGQSAVVTFGVKVNQ